ncbi:hypothetical protein SUDANB21_01890 [Streptomyces sp. enrichment culture]|uniref:hypothetical protein n=1 Tax=Streptomyces sp. enrichment culture TaxID=1795815 RepID=UPI0010C08FFF
MDSQAVLWLLAWGGVASVLLFVLQGLVQQLCAFIDACRPLVEKIRGRAGSAPARGNADEQDPVP